MRRRHEVDFTAEFDPEDDTLSILRRRYNTNLENLYDNYESLLQSIQDEQDGRQRILDAADNVSSAAQAGDITSIENAVSDIENELSDFSNATDEIQMYEEDIVRDVIILKKLENRLKYKPTVRPQMQREFAELINEARDF